MDFEAAAAFDKQSHSGSSASLLEIFLISASNCSSLAVRSIFACNVDSTRIYNYYAGKLIYIWKQFQNSQTYVGSK